MAGIHLTRMSAHAAYVALQEAYGKLYCMTEDGQKPDVDGAEENLKEVNNWLLALKNE